MANASHRIKDVRTGKEYPSKAAAGRDLAHLVRGDPKDQFVWFAIAKAFPARFRVMTDDGDWVALTDSSAPVGTLRPDAAIAPSKARVTTLAISEDKFEAVRTVLGTTTLRETVDRSFDEVLASAARREEVVRLRKMDGLELDKPSVMNKAWR